MIAGHIRVVAFDLDDTLAVSKSPIEPAMADLLARLLDRVQVCIISGGRFEQFQTQVLSRLELDPAERGRLHLMPTCGTRYYRWSGDDWSLVYAEDLTKAQKDTIETVLSTGAKQLGLWHEQPWGEIIEDRGSQITFSALGQAAPPQAKHEWDPDGSKRRALVAYAAPRLPELEVRSGGSTSVDVTAKGVDKAYGIRKLMAELDVELGDILFIGDRLDEGGNDYPVKALGVRCVSVHGWPQTAQYVAALLDPDVADPDLADPGPADPGPAEPAPAEPGPAEPGHLT